MSAGERAAPAHPAQITIDGKTYVADARRNLLEVALELGYDLPYFCWHPALGSVGACRQCAVTQFKDAQDSRGRVVMACMTPCSDGTRVSLVDAAAREMRSSVIELLMTSHPHDCPVCEEGGQCHLQDMTVMTGHAYRRYRGQKRTHHNQDLGPFVGHEMNRCIACYRCVRFYREYAGGEDLNVFGAHHHVYFGRASDGVLESPFSGNLAEVCPTGVFTDKTYGEHYTRKWDLQQAPSVCHHCAIGCNTLPGERYGRLKRIENRYHGALNGYFLCDRGRYGYQHVNADDRPRRVLQRAVGAAAQPVAAEVAVAAIAQWFAQGPVLGIGSPRASLEANHALRALVGDANFHRGTGAADSALDDLLLELLQTTPAQIASPHDAESADAVLVLGEDLLATGARLALSLRQSVRQAGFEQADAAGVPRWQDHSVRLLAQDRRSPLYVCTPAATGLDAIARRSWRGLPEAIAGLAQEIVHLLDYRQPRRPGLDDDEVHLAHDIASALKAARRPLIVAGTSSGSAALLRGAAAIAATLAAGGARPSLALLPAECNSLGAALVGGADLDAALQRLRSGDARSVLVLENNLFRRASAPALRAALADAQLAVIDVLASPTSAAAQWLLPAGSFAESDGTLVNYEGRAQRYRQVFVAADSDIRESWRWLQQIARASGRDLGDGLEPLTAACAARDPRLAGIVDAAPSARFRIAGSRIPRQPHRYSGRTAMHADREIHEPRPAQDGDTPLAFSMEGARVGLPPSEIPVFWYPRWNSVQSLHKFQQEIGGTLRGGDPGVRLIAPAGAAAPGEIGRVAPPPLPPGTLRSVWLYELFGSEELSVRAPAIATRVPAPYLALHPQTAQALELAAGAPLQISCEDQQWQAVLRLDPSLPPDAAGLPRGLPGVPACAAGAPLRIAGVRS